VNEEYSREYEIHLVESKVTPANITNETEQSKDEPICQGGEARPVNITTGE
jgi:hypothetical protein